MHSEAARVGWLAGDPSAEHLPSNLIQEPKWQGILSRPWKVASRQDPNYATLNQWQQHSDSRLPRAARLLHAQVTLAT